MPNQDFDTLLSKPKTAKRFGVTTRTVDLWSDQPELRFPTPCIINGRKYFSAWQIEDWLESRKPGGPPMPADAVAASHIARPKLGLIPPEPISIARLARLRERREAKQSRVDRRSATELTEVGG
jgi:hypothetical protein